MKLTIKTAADLEADALAREAEKLRAEALAYLRETDWFVTRQAETGKPIPEDVAEKRAAARKVASA